MGTVTPIFNRWELTYLIDCINMTIYKYEGENKKRVLELKSKLEHNLSKCMR